MNMTHSRFLTVSKGPIELQMFFKVVKCLWDLDVLHFSERQQGDEIIVAVPGISNILYIHKEAFSQLFCKRCKTVSWYFSYLSPEDNTGLINTFLIFGLAVCKLFEEHCNRLNIHQFPRESLP